MKSLRATKQQISKQYGLRTAPQQHQPDRRGEVAAFQTPDAIRKRKHYGWTAPGKFYELGGWKCVGKWLVQVIWSAPWLCSTANALVLASTNAL